MPAITYSKTATSDATWDGPANEARLKADGDAAYLKKAFAWQDPEKSGDTKDSFRFIHHEVDSDGTVGAANLAACESGCGVLNGARGGTTIPEEDKAAVHAHLAHHLEDAGRTAPELKSSRPRLGRPAGRERGILGIDRQERTALGQIEVRATTAGAPKIVGYAAVFDQPTVIEDWWDEYAETVGVGAFTKTIKEGDCRCLWNHDANYVLGRTKSGTLTLAEDSHGLHYEAEPPDTNWARDLLETIRRGDVDGSSFGFRVIRDRWGTIPNPMNDGDGDEADAMDCRTLLEVQLYDVSPVAFPAYPQTDASVRAALAGAGFDLDGLTRVVVRAQRGLSLANRDREQIRAAVDYLSRYLPSSAVPGAPARSGHPPTREQLPAPPSDGHANPRLAERLAHFTQWI